MTEEEKILRKAQGYTIYEHQGKTICLNLENFDKEKFCKDWGFKEVEIFTEDNGNKVLYDPTQYRVINSYNNENYLRYKGESETPSQPIGCTFYCGMFKVCFNLQSLDLSNWDVSKGISFSEMFSGCFELQSLNVENWDVSNGTDFSEMFSACGCLQSLNIENWDVSNGTNFSKMFYCCGSLQFLNLENWDVSKGLSFTDMFNGCSELSERYRENDSAELIEKLTESYQEKVSDELVEKLLKKNNTMNLF